MAEKTNGKNNLLPVIGAFKLLKAVLLFATAYGLRHLRLGGHVDQTLTDWVRAIRIDPENHYAHLFVSRATGVPVARLHHLAIGTFCYAALFLCEGIGLVLRKTWGEYFTIATTGAFLPLEVYELLFKPEHKLVKALLLAFNLAIVVYLIFNLRRSRQDRPAPSPGPAPAPAA